MLSDFKSYALATDEQGFGSRIARKWLTNSNLRVFLFWPYFRTKTLHFEKQAKMKAKNGISSTFLTIKLCATVVQMHALKHDGKRHRLRANGH
jgi:hypothetical protein